MKRPTLGTILATTACIVALSSTGVAADAASLITGKQVKDHSLTGKDIKAHSITAANLAPGVVTSGPQGPQGPQGIPGVPGSARAYVMVNSGSGGSIVAAWTKGTWSFTHPSVGLYCMTPPSGIDPASNPAVVTAEWGNSSGSDLEAYWNAGVHNCPVGKYEIRTYKLPSGTATASDSVGFIVAVP